MFKSIFICFLGLLILTTEARCSSVIERQENFLTLLPAVSGTTTIPVDPNASCIDPNSRNPDLALFRRGHNKGKI
jgi:hypothetical protein